MNILFVSCNFSKQQIKQDENIACLLLPVTYEYSFHKLGNQFNSNAGLPLNNGHDARVRYFSWVCRLQVNSAKLNAHEAHDTKCFNARMGFWDMLRVCSHSVRIHSRFQSLLSLLAGGSLLTRISCEGTHRLRGTGGSGKENGLKSFRGKDATYSRERIWGRQDDWNIHFFLNSWGIAAIARVVISFPTRSLITPIVHPKVKPKDLFQCFLLTRQQKKLMKRG